MLQNIPQELVFLCRRWDWEAAVREVHVDSNSQNEGSSHEKDTRKEKLFERSLSCSVFNFTSKKKNIKQNQ